MTHTAALTGVALFRRALQITNHGMLSALGKWLCFLFCFVFLFFFPDNAFLNFF